MDYEDVVSMFILLFIIIYNFVCFVVVLFCKEIEVLGYFCYCEVSRWVVFCKSGYLCMVIIYISYVVGLKLYKYFCEYGFKNENFKEVNIYVIEFNIYDCVLFDYRNIYLIIRVKN